MTEFLLAAPLIAVRIDLWLDVACLYKTRAEAQRACRGGKVSVNGQSVKPHKLIKIGDEIRLTRGAGRRQVFRVAGLADKHIAKTDARALYLDMTPPPTADELERRAFLRAYPRAPAGAPDKRQRRQLRKLKGLPR
jgi:ribosome-associated heat shock protein Hsp15